MCEQVLDVFFGGGSGVGGVFCDGEVGCVDGAAAGVTEEVEG